MRTVGNIRVSSVMDVSMSVLADSSSLHFLVTHHVSIDPFFPEPVDCVGLVRRDEDGGDHTTDYCEH